MTTKFSSQDKNEIPSSSSSARGEEDSSASSSSSCWLDLTSWVRKKEHGGHVHSALDLGVGEGDGDNNRGVFAAHGSIAEGELLIRLPARCVLSGRTVLSSSMPDDHETLRELEKKSSWMRCLVAYYRAKQQQQQEQQSITNNPNNNNNCNEHYWKPYFDSLPKTYETLLRWSDEEVRTYLKGTTLGATIVADRTEGSMKARYEKAVRPVLTKLGLVEEEQSEKEEMAAFLEACTCISTRGFHCDTAATATPGITDTTPSSSCDSSYRGPFLLPIIDLLNHNPAKSCTTLRFSDGCFTMEAERPIAKGEEIFHSYGDSMTSAQLLQTFGFVMLPPPSAGGGGQKQERRFLTPASLSLSRHLVPACCEIKRSGIPQRLQSKLAAPKKAAEHNNNAEMEMEEEEEESWEVADLPVRNDDGILSEDILIDCNNNNNNNDNKRKEDQDDEEDQKGGLTDELITWMCLQFLPTEAYEEMRDDDGRVSSLLDASILQDLYLGILVCRSLLLALHKKLDDYHDDDDENDKKRKKECPCETTDRVVDRLECMLSKEEPRAANNSLRGRYGRTIRHEEWSNLKVWALQVSGIMRCLYEELKDGASSSNDDDADEDEEQPPKAAKRAKAVVKSSE